MGTNAAVNLANFTLFTYEYEHLVLCVLNREYDTLRHLHYQKRYLDDIFTGNNNNFDEYKDDIYPQDTLTLNLEQEGLPLHCLDFHFYYNTLKNRLSHKLHSKRDDTQNSKTSHTPTTHTQTQR